MFDPAHLSRLTYFVAVVDTGSFTRAAERLGITKAVVSQQVARLEAATGATLLIRTTRQVRPTEAGLALHARCSTILREAEEAFGELAVSVSEPTGTLRLTAQLDYGTTVVAPVAAAFTKIYPNCQVQLNLSDRRFNLSSGEWDMAVRVGWLDDSNLRARRIGTFRQVVVGASTHRQSFGAVAHPADLSVVPFVANASLDEPLLWRFSRTSAEHQMVRANPIVTIDSTPSVLTAVKQGIGISIVPDFVAREELRAGRLFQLLPDWQLPVGGIYAVYPSIRFHSPKVASFIEILTEAEQNRNAESHV